MATGRSQRERAGSSAARGSALLGVTGVALDEHSCWHGCLSPCGHSARRVTTCSSTCAIGRTRVRQGVFESRCCRCDGAARRRLGGLLLFTIVEGGVHSSSFDVSSLSWHVRLNARVIRDDAIHVLALTKFRVHDSLYKQLHVLFHLLLSLTLLLTL